MYRTPPVKISDSDLKDRPNAAMIVQTVRGRQHEIICRGKRRFGRRLLCPICGTYVEAVYLPDDKEEFGCQECYRSETKRFISGPKGYEKLCAAMKASWGDKQY